MPSKKRGRDDDGDGDVAIGGTEGFTEHRNVRDKLAPPSPTRCPLLRQATCFLLTHYVNYRNACSPCPSARLPRRKDSPFHLVSIMALCRPETRSARSTTRTQSRTRVRALRTVWTHRRLALPNLHRLPLAWSCRGLLRRLPSATLRRWLTDTGLMTLIWTWTWTRQILHMRHTTSTIWKLGQHNQIPCSPAALLAGCPPQFTALSRRKSEATTGAAQQGTYCSLVASLRLPIDACPGPWTTTP